MRSDERRGLLFVACMFIGAGIGSIFGRPDVGGAIGMGFGFLLMALIREKNVEVTPLTISLPRTFAQLSLLVVGALMISCGSFLIYRPELIYPYLAGIGTILVGFLILLAGLIGFRRSE
ncbi:hypothetical protein [Candidatus Korarchaeum cryptofilum]|uniref:Uncharacterized protein n=1 Tax=Korarchaeum cryptofilum (strain OPF8) TaxID=374847 RepID=B1L438_KORCO|nr:hypothetical protein [Candidatus Korarchaeum cryptofilum]ACB07217.1 hypothetical protein Kcr_0464 [Candidatus Korarchaeum cryptofilum OPF8]